MLVGFWFKGKLEVWELCEEDDCVISAEFAQNQRKTKSRTLRKGEKEWERRIKICSKKNQDEECRDLCSDTMIDFRENEKNFISIVNYSITEEEGTFIYMREKQEWHMASCTRKECNNFLTNKSNIRYRRLF